MEQYSVLHMMKVKELGGIGMHIDRHYTGFWRIIGPKWQWGC
jgi:hypothetical protein